jgi:hypothetical protein
MSKKTLKKHSNSGLGVRNFCQHGYKNDLGLVLLECWFGAKDFKNIFAPKLQKSMWQQI